MVSARPWRSAGRPGRRRDAGGTRGRTTPRPWRRRPGPRGRDAAVAAAWQFGSRRRAPAWRDRSRRALASRPQPAPKAARSIRRGSEVIAPHHACRSFVAAGTVDRRPGRDRRGWPAAGRVDRRPRTRQLRIARLHGEQGGAANRRRGGSVGGDRVEPATSSSTSGSRESSRRRTWTVALPSVAGRTTRERKAPERAGRRPPRTPATVPAPSRASLLWRGEVTDARARKESATDRGLRGGQPRSGQQLAGGWRCNVTVLLPPIRCSSNI